jgi:hypothetical protein
VCWLSTQLVNEDALEDALADADVPTLCALKGVSLAWRARARRVLCARLCARVGLPLTSNLVEVTELDLSDSRAAGRLIADAADASCWLPNLAKVTGLGGFDVDVATLRSVASSVDYSYPMAGVRACIRGEGEAPMEVLLAAFTLRHGEARVPAYAFRGDMSMRSITLPTGLTSIGRWAFEGCSSMTSIELPAGLTSIGGYAFSRCSSLTSIALPPGLTSIGEYAFRGCSSLTSIELPAGLTSLGDDAFQGCSSLTSSAVGKMVVRAVAARARVAAEERAVAARVAEAERAADGGEAAGQAAASGVVAGARAAGARAGEAGVAAGNR